MSAWLGLLLLGGCLACQVAAQDPAESAVVPELQLCVVDEQGEAVGGAQLLHHVWAAPVASALFGAPIGFSHFGPAVDIQDFITTSLLGSAEDGPAALQARLGTLAPIAETDRDGLAIVRFAGNGPMTLWVTKDGTGTSGLLTFGVEADAMPGPQVVTLRRQGRIEGTLVNDADKATRPRVLFVPAFTTPGPHARVPAPVRCDDDGRFGIDVDAPCDGTLYVRTDSGWRCGGSVATGAGDTTEVTVVLRPRAPLRGRVVDGSGQPVSGGVVCAVPWWPTPWITAEIAKDGSFEVPTPLQQGYVGIEALGPDFMSENVLRVGDLVRSEDFITITVSREVEINGLLLDAEGAPVQGADVHGVLDDDATWGQIVRHRSGLKATTDSEGQFSFSGLVPKSRYDVWVFDDGCRASASQVMPGTKDLVLRLELASVEDQ